MSGRERIMSSDGPPDDESPWWSRLPPDQQVRIIVWGKRLPLDDGLSRRDRHKQAIVNSQDVIEKIWNYMKDNEQSFPNFENRKISKISGLGMLVMLATPGECEALMNCESVDKIYPDKDLKIELL